MKTSAKIWLIAGASFVMLGVLIFAGAMTANHWDFSRLSTDKFETNTYEIKKEFTNIEIDTITADVIFTASDDGRCRVVCYEEKNVNHSVKVENGTLTVTVSDDRGWYDHVGISFHSPKITVYLPGTEYASLMISGSTGGIEIPGGFTFDSAALSLSTGDIYVSDVTFTGDIWANVSTGEVKLKNVTCKNIFSAGATGDISLENVTAAEKFSIERSTGDVILERSDASEISVKTSTGDVTGTLLSEKVFSTDSSTGDVSVPETLSGGKCRIVTTTGDISIRIAD